MHLNEDLRKKQLPAAYVDLDAFDNNAQAMAENFKSSKLSIRIATKSVRCPELIHRALKSSNVYKGLMCYSAQEILELAQLGLDDFLLAYPTLQTTDIQALAKTLDLGKSVWLVVDNKAHLELLNLSQFKNNPRFGYMVEADMSLHLPSVVVGVRRSPLITPEKVLSFCKYATEHHPELQFAGIMAYEAQVAGLPDKNPFKTLLNPALRLIRKISVNIVIKRRKKLRRLLDEENLTPKIFNAGGTGSLSFNTKEEETITEVTAGSGFYCPHLFDYYSNFKLQPACYFALPSVRIPEKGWLTCLGGGYIASGEPGWDRVPRTANKNFKLSSFEACGEVQTPVQCNEELGQPVFFRHAKAGELLERFNDVHFVQKNNIVGTTKTYRGRGWCFL